MKVFISSVISGYESFRDAAAEAVRVLGHQVIRAEDFPADAGAPQQVCLKGVREADLVLLLMGERYGYIAPSGLSATHEEYRESKERRPILVFVESAASRDIQQRAFVDEVQSYVAGHFRATFVTEQDLKDSVTLALHRHEMSIAASPVDEEEMLARAANLPSSGRGMPSSATLFMGLAGGPRQQVLRPTEIEDPALECKIMKEALFGAVKLFDTARGSASRIDGGALIVEQPGGAASVRVDELGTVQLVVPARNQDKSGSYGFQSLIEEDVLHKISQALLFSGWLLDEIDVVTRLSDIVIVAGLSGANYMGWQTRADAAASGGSVKLGNAGEWICVQLSPPRRNRAALLMDTARIAEDIVTLLRRKMRS